MCACWVIICLIIVCSSYKVQYSDRLVSLLREVRQLSGLGFLVPAKIQHTAATAMKFYKHAVSLKKVNFKI